MRTDHEGFALQFYLYAPLIFLPIWYSETLGLLWWFINLIVFTAVPAYISSYNHMPPTGLSIIMLLFLMKSLCGTMSPVTHPDTCYFFLCSVSPDLPNQNLHGFNGMDDFYIKPWCRFQPYLMGLLLGYILFKLRGKTIHIPQVTNCI